MTWIRIADINKAPITPQQKIDLINNAMVEWAYASALAIVHGVERGAKMYAEMGGQVRFDDEQEPVIWFDER